MSVYRLGRLTSMNQHPWPTFTAWCHQHKQYGVGATAEQERNSSTSIYYYIASTEVYASVSESLLQPPAQGESGDEKMENTAHAARGDKNSQPITKDQLVRSN